MQSDTFYGDFMVKLIWTLSGNSIYHIFCFIVLVAHFQ